MSHSIFVSDLHLTPERPAASGLFFDFVGRTAVQAEALYILGDLFDYWVGDDDLAEAFNASVAQALRGLAGRGISLHLMQGNRDLLLGTGFAAHCGAELIVDPTVLDLYGTRTLLMHGDTLCTGDVEYQKFRAYARDPETQRKFLAQPLAERRLRMTGMRAESEKSKRDKAPDIMDVTVTAVEQTLRNHGYPRLIHGHTHRPARHLHVVDGHPCERWVLSDWYGRGGYLRCDSKGCRAEWL